MRPPVGLQPASEQQGFRSEAAIRRNLQGVSRAIYFPLGMPAHFSARRPRLLLLKAWGIYGGFGSVRRQRYPYVRALRRTFMEHRTELEELLLAGLPPAERQHVVEVIV